MAIYIDNSKVVKIRTAKLRNRRLLKATQSKSPYFERDEPDTA
jgi:hypothetical protein